MDTDEVRREIAGVVEIVFNVLSLCRAGYEPGSGAFRAALYRRGLWGLNWRHIPRASFWVRLCRRAALLDEGEAPQPTIFVPEWFDLDPLGQARLLLGAWVKLPEGRSERRLRRRVVAGLKRGEIPGERQLKRLYGLQLLGGIAGGRFSPMGKLVFSELSGLERAEAAAWTVQGDTLTVPYPPDWGLVWRLEEFVGPDSLGEYRLRKETLQTAAIADAAAEFRAVLAAGIQGELPAWLDEALPQGRLVKLRTGVVLEFRDAKDLAGMRAERIFRKDLQALISPRHALIGPTSGSEVLKKLKDRGLITASELERVAAEYGWRDAVRGNEAFTAGERAFLLALVQLAGVEKPELRVPAGLIGKLSAALPIELRAAAARRVNAVVDRDTGRFWIPENEFPEEPEAELIARLQGAIGRMEPIWIGYRKSLKAEVEQRRITPLLLEARRGRTYLIAHDHGRQAQRTFRVDRIVWVEG